MISNDELQEIVRLYDGEGLPFGWRKVELAKELLRLRTLIPLAGRLVSECNEKMFGSRTVLHLELEIEKYRKDFQIE